MSAPEWPRNCVTCGQPVHPNHPDDHIAVICVHPEALAALRHAPTEREIFEAGFLAREESLALHDLGMGRSDQAERDQAYTRWQQARNNR
ncbi:hypothetical protein [Nocardia nova]|uniref:hypothetical protein n=1 Tax=Nocardia nova TaxID=37330 RepID=UPI00189429FF|nr:hypothetical protein [Nocardia nova]MBF6277023.1 hypothetical protein [Nocardia nova]